MVWFGFSVFFCSFIYSMIMQKEKCSADNTTKKDVSFAV